MDKRSRLASARRGAAVGAAGAIVAALVSIPSPAIAVSGQKNCSGNGRIAVVATARPATGATITARSGTMGASWQRNLNVVPGTERQSFWGFATPVVSGRWGASPRKADSQFSARAACTYGSVTSWPIKRTVNLRGRTCPAGQNVIVQGDGYYRVILFYTAGGVQRRVQMGRTSGLLSINSLDTDKRSLSGARVQVRAPASARADSWVRGAATRCSRGVTSGD